MTASAPETIGHYRITSLLGEGGMGEVYLADDTRLGRRVAIKILPATVSRDADATRRMLREARAAASVDHPNVCTIHEVGEHEGRPFIVMQYIEGETLYERLLRSRLTLAECLDIAAQVASALDEAHRHGVVHRDIKTLNIMLTPRGQVKVLDFGLAKVEQASNLSTDMLLSKPGTVAGTAPYMSPEQLRGLPTDGRSDIFSFGIVLHEMAAGQRPFERDSGVATITAILFEEPPAIDDVAFAPLVPILRRALSKEPAKRFQTAAQLLDALRDAQRPRAGRRPPTAEITAVIDPPSVSRPGARIDSLAVLAFAAADVEYLAQGLANGVVDALSQVRSLRVMAPTAIERYEEERLDARRIGRELNVAALAVLHVRVEADDLHAEIELLTTGDGAQRWTSEYAHPVSEVTQLAEAIAVDIVEQTRGPGTSSAPRRAVKRKQAVDPEAQQLFLKGRYQWVKRHPVALKQALGYFQEAVEHDPSYALAYAGLADSFVMLGTMQALPPRELMPKAKAAAQRAIELDPTLAEPHASLGAAAGYFEWDWETARRELEEAMHLNPNYPWAPHWLGQLHSGRGQTRRGLELAELAQSLDPLSPIINTGAGISLHLARRYDDAVALYRHIIFESETAFSAAHYYLALSLEQRGEYDDAISHLLKVIEMAGPVSVYYAALAHCYGRAGRVDDAEQVIEQMRELGKQRYVTPYGFYIAWTGLDRNDEALKALEAAFEERNALLWYIGVDPRLDRLRQDPRFAQLVERYGLSPVLAVDG